MSYFSLDFFCRIRRILCMFLAVAMLLPMAPVYASAEEEDETPALIQVLPEETEPAAAEPVATEPVAAEPVATEPVATEPVATEPVATEPVATEPAAAESPATEPPETVLLPEQTEEPEMDEQVMALEAKNESVSDNRVRVTFVCEPEDLELSVFQVNDDTGMELFAPEEDRTYLLEPGMYTYEAVKEGYDGDLSDILVVTGGDMQIDITLTKIAYVPIPHPSGSGASSNTAVASTTAEVTQKLNFLKPYFTSASWNSGFKCWNAGLNHSQLKAIVDNGLLANPGAVSLKELGITKEKCGSSCHGNGYANATQCMGFATWLEYVLFRSNHYNNASSWTKYTKSNLPSNFTIQPGDYIRIGKGKGSGHSVMIVSVSGSSFTCAEVWGAACDIHWCSAFCSSYARSINGNANPKTTQELLACVKSSPDGYIWRYKPMEDGGQSGETTPSIPANLEAPVLSINSTSIYENEQLVASWNNAAGADYYEFHILDSTNTTRIGGNWAVEGTTYSCYIPFSGSAAQTYTVHATSINKAMYAAGYTYYFRNSNEIKVTVKPKYYNISLNANGGSGVASSLSKRHNEEISLPTPTREGYIFKGWAKSASATTPNFQPGATVTQNADVTLYAIWSKISPLDWRISSDGTLTISGTGEITEEAAEWLARQDEIKSVVIERGPTGIGECAFSGCSSLTSVTIPDSVTSIGDSAFWGCRGLTSVMIPNGVTNIGNYAFDGCSSLTSVTIPDSVTSIGNYAFDGCSSLTSVTIPDSVTSIGFGAFYYCSSLTSVTIPSSVTTIGGDAFSYTNQLVNIQVDSGNAYYKSVNGVLYSKDETELIAVPCAKTGTFVIPGSVTSIGDRAFSYCSSLTSVTIPDSVTSIGYRAFDGCSSLTSVTIPDSVTSIGNSTFDGCSSLTSVTIPNGVTSIGNYAFDGCSSLTSVTIPNSVTSIGYRAFSDCSSLTSITIPNSVTRIGGEAFVDCSNLIDVYYIGTAQEWGSISVPPIGTKLRSDANIHYTAGAAVEITVPAYTLTAGESMNLSVRITQNNPGNDQIEMYLSNRDSEYASLSEAGKLTAKTVSKPVTVTVHAKSVRGTAAESSVAIEILPGITRLSIAHNGEDVTGKVVTLDVSKVHSVTFQTEKQPQGAGGSITWTTSDINGRYGFFIDNGDGTCTVSDLRLIADTAGYVTLTAATTNGKSAIVKLMLTAQPDSLEILGIPEGERIRGGTKLTLSAGFNGFTTDKRVTWSVSGHSGAKISSAGVLTTPAVKTATQIVVSARLTAAPEISCTRTITLVPAVSKSVITLDGQKVAAITVNALDNNALMFDAYNLPADAVQTGTWSISPTTGARIDGGTVLIEKPGTYTVKFTADDGSKKTASVKITAIMPVTSVSLSGVYGLVSGGGATVRSVVNVDATNKKLVWSSSDETVATVSAAGAVKAKPVYEQKQVTITARAADGFGAEGSLTLTVYPKSNVLGIRDETGEIVNEKTLYVDALTVAQLDLTAWHLNDYQADAVWKASGKDIVMVENGRVTILKPGTTTITVTNSAKQTGRVTLTIRNLVHGVQVTPAAGTLVNGMLQDGKILLASGKGKISLTGSILNADASIKKLAWTTDNSNAAVVSAAGVVTAKAKVTAPTDVTITACATDGSGETASVTVTVVPLASAVTLRDLSGMLSGNTGTILNGMVVTLPLSAMQNICLEAFPTNPDALQQVTWKSSAPSVAMVSNGVVTALKTGTVTITAAAADGSGKTASVKLIIV